MVPETSATLWAILDFGLCSAPGVIARLSFQFGRQDEPNPGFRRIITLGIASVMLAVMLAMTCAEVKHLKEWSRVVAFCAGFLAQDIATWLLSPKGKGAIRKWIARVVLGNYEEKKK